MPASKSDKAIATISEVIQKLSIAKDQLSSMTRKDINYLRGRLDLLEYLLTPTSGAKIEPLKAPGHPWACSVCHEMKPSIWQHKGVKYCAEHMPAGITWPIGMHGDDLEAYKEQK